MSIRGGLWLGSAIVISAVVSSDVVAAEKGLSKFRNELNQISWRIVANNRMKDTKLSQDDQWIKNPEYYESIMKVIGKAIGDCVTKQNEFANPTEDGLIVFAASPEGYRGEHWNAVILYNYLNKMLNVYRTLFDKDAMQQVKDELDLIRKHYESYYTQYCADDADKLINDLPTKLDDAVNDIQQYVNALNLDKILDLFLDARIRNALLQDNINEGARIKYINIISDYIKRPILTIATDLSHIYSDEKNGCITYTHGFISDEVGAEQQIYIPTFRYQDGKLYISEIDTASQSSGETKEEVDDSICDNKLNCYMISVSGSSRYLLKNCGRSGIPINQRVIHTL